MSAPDFNSGVTAPATPPANGVTPPVGNPQEPAPSVNPDQGFINFGGVNLSPAEALKKLEHANQFIETLKAEKSQVEAKAGEADKLKELLTALQAGNAPVPQAQPAVASPEAPAPAVDVAAITATIMGNLDAKKTAETEDSNFKAVSKQLTSVYGDAVNAEVAKVAADNDMTVDEVAVLARKQPKVFLKLFGDKLSPSRTSASLSPGRSNSFQPQAPSGPSGYHDAKTTKDQVAIYRDRLAAHGL